MSAPSSRLFREEVGILKIHSSSFFALCGALALAACTTVQPREPICEPPPIPPELLLPCEEPELLTDGSFASLYQQALRDVGPWGRCVRKDDKLISIVKYREEVCAKMKADAEKAKQPKPWYQP